MCIRDSPTLVLALIVAVSGCSSVKGLFKKDKDKNEGVPVATLFDKAHSQMEHGNWSNASETWVRLIAQYPYGAYTEQAMMEQAYAQFKSGKHEDAISSCLLYTSRCV